MVSNISFGSRYTLSNSKNTYSEIGKFQDYIYSQQLRGANINDSVETKFDPDSQYGFVSTYILEQPDILDERLECYLQGQNITNYTKSDCADNNSRLDMMM